jgi:hypothetical protein
MQTSPGHQRNTSIHIITCDPYLITSFLSFSALNSRQGHLESSEDSHACSEEASGASDELGSGAGDLDRWAAGGDSSVAWCRGGWGCGRAGLSGQGGGRGNGGGGSCCRGARGCGLR